MSVQVSVATVDEREICVLGVSGDVDLSSAGALREGVEHALALPASRYVVELSGVDFADCALVNALVVLRSRALAAGRPTALLGAPPSVVRLLEILELADTFDAVDSVDGAPSRLPSSQAQHRPANIGGVGDTTGAPGRLR